MVIEYKPNNPTNFTKIKIIGVGGGGGNAINSMIRAGIKGVDFYAANTDTQHLNMSLASNKIYLGKKLTQGRGAGAEPEMGRKAAIESMEEIEQMLMDTDMLFIAAGMGGGTGTGAAPEIARKAKAFKVLTLAVVTIPFGFEGNTRLSRALAGILELQGIVDSIIVLQNDKIYDIFGDLTRKEAYAQLDKIIVNSARTITDIVNDSGDINIDFANVKKAMCDSGYSVISIGMADGDNRVSKAIKDVLFNPLYSDVDLSGCKGLLVNIYDSGDMKMSEEKQIREIITNETGLSGEIFFGNTTDESLDGTIKIAMIATGLSTSKAVTALMNNDSIEKPEPIAEPPIVISLPRNGEPSTAKSWEKDIQRVNDSKDRQEQNTLLHKPQITTFNPNISHNPCTTDEIKQGNVPSFIRKLSD